MKRPVCLLIATAALLGLCALSGVLADDKPAKGRPTEVTPPWRDGMRVTLDVMVDGKQMRTVTHRGKTYLPVARLGAEYRIRVTNQGSNRVTAIVSVDGLSVINGQPASEDHAGYIVDPRSHIVVDGWRRNLDSVAAFSFEERDNSYASRVGRPENIGVIGLVAIEEQVVRPRPRMPRPLEDAPEAGFARKQSDVGGTGTGYGREIDSRIYYAPFVRSANKRTITRYYDTAENLRKAGVPVDLAEPIPFPGDQGFVPPPPR